MVSCRQEWFTTEPDRLHVCEQWAGHKGSHSCYKRHDGAESLCVERWEDVDPIDVVSAAAESARTSEATVDAFILCDKADDQLLRSMLGGMLPATRERLAERLTRLERIRALVTAYNKQGR